jgi:hypothetical protein
MARSAFHFMAYHTGELILVQAKGDRDTDQAAWRLEVQGQFLEWLGAGGFHSDEEEKQEEKHARNKNGNENENENENSGTAAAVSQSRPGTQCEELKFTRVRISDAV